MWATVTDLCQLGKIEQEVEIPKDKYSPRRIIDSLDPRDASKINQTYLHILEMNKQPREVK